MTSLKLTTPIKQGEEEITELNFRKPIARDLRNFSMNEIHKYSNIEELTSLLTGMPLSVLGQMDALDLVRCIKVIEGFFTVSQVISENA